MKLNGSLPKIPDPKPLCDALLKLQKTMPPIFAGTSLDKMTGNGYRWRTLQNEKARGEAPSDMFIRQGTRKLLVDRDRFLAYWQSKFTSAINSEGR